MATLLYEELGIPATATAEEIRKAYKKRALQTHPDRLPPNATAEQKKEADEKFRKVNHAYEVLSDAEKRKEYDFHGIWPPPEAEVPEPSGGNSQFRSFHADPFFNHQSHHDFQSFAFSDPFALFNSIFEDIMGSRAKPFGFSSGPFQDPFDRFAMLERELDGDFDNSMHSGGPSSHGMFPSMGMGWGGLGGFGPFPPMQPDFGMRMLPQPPRQGSSGMGGRKWVSESYMTQSINGVTQTVKKQRDFEGNEHITRTFADGRKTYTINGVEQSPPGSLPNTNEQRRISAPAQPPPSPNAFQRLPPASSNTAQPPSRPPSYRSNSHGYPGEFAQGYSTSHSYAHGAPQPTPTMANPVASRKPSAPVGDMNRPRVTRSATTALPSERDRRPRDNYSDLHHHHGQYQSYPRDTHHNREMGPDPLHPNFSSYYLDQDRKHRKHHHGWNRT